MSDNADNPVPTITLRLLDPAKFNVEIHLNVPSLFVARAMINEAKETIRSMIAGREALQFSQKMAEASHVAGAISKPSLIKM